MATLITLDRQATSLNWDARSSENWPAAFKRVAANGTVRLWRWNNQRFGLGAVGYGKNAAGGQFFDLTNDAWAFRIGLGSRAGWFQDRTYRPNDATAGGNIDTDEIYWEGNLPPGAIAETIILAILDAADLATIAADRSAGNAASAAAILNPSRVPTLSAATVVDATLTLRYNEALDQASVPAAGDFTVTVDGVARAAAAVAVSGSAVTLTLASPVTHGQVVLLSYVKGANPIQNAAGTDAAALTDQAVTNGTARPVPPPTTPSGPLDPDDVARMGRSFRSLTPGDAWVPALEITHPSNPAVLRYVKDVVDRMSGGETYTAVGEFLARLGDEVEGQAPNAEVGIPHVGSALADWMDTVDGGTGGTVTYREIGPDGEVGYERVLDIVAGVLTAEGAVWSLGYAVAMDRALVQIRYDPVTAPGLFGLG